MKVVAMDQAMCLPFKVSTTTSNFMIGVTAAASAGIYLARGYIDPGIAMPVVLGVLVGATLGVRILARTATWTAVLYLAFLVAWGLNYRRVRLSERVSFDAAAATPDAARQLALQAVTLGVYRRWWLFAAAPRDVHRGAGRPQEDRGNRQGRVGASRTRHHSTRTPRPPGDAGGSGRVFALHVRPPARPHLHPHHGIRVVALAGEPVPGLAL